MLATSENTPGENVFNLPGGVRLSASPSAAVASLAAWGVAGVVLRKRGFSGSKAIAGGLLAVLLHWLSDLAHQGGHAVAANRTGYPMTGLRFWGLFSTSLYPADEPVLPARIHVQRALGGPTCSLILGLLLAPFLWRRSRGTLLRELGVLAVVENLVVFGLGAFLPLGFTDGSTLLNLWRQRERP